MKLIQARTLITSCAIAALLSAPVLQAENTHLGKDVSSSDEIIDLLMPSPSNMKTRGLRLKTETSTDAPEVEYAAEAEVAAAPVSEPKSISLEIYFEFDSATLSDEAVAQLAPVGEALRSEELAALAFQLEGYTDASGDEQYNLSLSQRRAEAVRNFFAQQYGIPMDRLSSTGRGEADLLDPENPTSGVNRRVKIIAQ